MAVVALVTGLTFGLDAIAQDAPLDAALIAPATPIEVAPPPPAPRAIARLAAAWTPPSRSLAERAAAVRAVADELGVVSVDPLARAVLWDDAAPESRRARAEAAVALAPALPMAQAALASAAWSEGSYAEATSAALAALQALDGNLAARLWLAVTGSVLAFAALVLGVLAFLAARGAAGARFAWHDLGDAVEPAMPTVARIAALAALVVAPAALGEGAAGLALALVALGCATPSRAQQAAVAAAALLFVAALHPLAERAGQRIAAVGTDAIAIAAAAAETGFLDPADALRLARGSAPHLAFANESPASPTERPTLDSAVASAASGQSGAEGAHQLAVASAASGQSGAGGAHQLADPLAVAAVASFARRSGEVGAADLLYARLTAGEGADTDVLGNAAGVKLALGDAAAAVALYRRALAIEESATLWFQLSQAHGAAIDVEQHDRALAAAQSLDPEAVSELTVQLADSPGPWAPAQPISLDRLWERTLAVDGAAAAAALRARVAPGWLGRSAGLALAAFAAAVALGVLVAGRFERSTACRDCGTRLCPRCDAAPRGEARCEACQRRRFEGRAAWERPAGAGSLGRRALAAAQLAAPGLVEASGRRAPVGLAVALALGGAAVAWFGRGAVLPDPGVVGGAGAIAFGSVAIVCLVALVCVAAIARAGSRSARS